MKVKYCFITFFAVISLGCTQFTITYTPSIFENIKLGEPPNGVYIPQDSFLNVLRNPTYRNSWNLAPYTYADPFSGNGNNLGNNYVNNIPLPKLSAQDTTTPTASKKDSSIVSDNNDKVMDNNEGQKPHRRTIRRRQRISAWQTGNPKIHTPSVVDNIGNTDIPEGVYIPPDSLFNVLRNPAHTNNQVHSRIIPNSDYGLPRNHQQLFVQPPVQDEPMHKKPVRPAVRYGAPSSENLDDEDNGSKLTSSSKRRQGTQTRRMPLVRPTSLPLDPSKEYPADSPEDEMPSHLRSNVEYSDIDENVQIRRVSDGKKKPKIRISRRRKQTGVKPDFIEDTYLTRTYSPSVFENIGLGEAPSGVQVPSDSMLNLLKENRRQRQPEQVERRTTVQQPPIMRQPDPVVVEEILTPNAEEYVPVVETREASKKKSRQMDELEVPAEVEFGTRIRRRDPILTFRESSEYRRRSHSK